MVLSILDKILLSLLAIFRRETFEERIESIKSCFILWGFALFFFGTSFVLVPFLIILYGILFGTLSGLTSGDLVKVNSFMNKEGSYVFAVFAIIAVCFLIAGFSLEKHLQKIIEKHAYIESAKVEEKEIYTPDSEVDVSVYAETFRAAKTVISAKKPFSNKELNSFKDKKIFIEAFKGDEKKVVHGGKAEIVLTNEDEITKLNIPEEALNYKIEKVLLTKEVTQRICNFIKEETKTFRTKIFLSASVDEDAMKKIKNQKELDDLLNL